MSQAARFTENLGGKVGRITLTGVVTEFPIPSPNSHPFMTGNGPDGNVWFYDEANSNINRITPNGLITEHHIPPPPGSRVLGITTGPDGNLWLAETDAGKIGRLSQ